MHRVEFSFIHSYDLDLDTLARVGQFDLIGAKTAQKRSLNKHRMSRQMYAITCCTDVSSEWMILCISLTNAC